MRRPFAPPPRGRGRAYHNQWQSRGPHQNNGYRGLRRGGGGGGPAYRSRGGRHQFRGWPY